MDGNIRLKTYLLELLNGTLVDTATFVDQVTCNPIVSVREWVRLSSAFTGGGRFARVDVPDDNDVDMSLFFTVKEEDTSATIIEVVRCI